MSPFEPSRSAVVLAAVCLLSTVAGVAAFAADAGAQSSSSPSVSVTNVTHTPQTPAAGETFEVEVRIANHEGAGGAFDISEVYARGVDGRYVADDLGTLPPGTSTVVTLPVTVAEPGWKTFAVHVNGGGTSRGIVNVRHPVTVHVVDERRPQIELSVAEAVPGATRPVNVTVANGGANAVRQVSVDVSSPTAEFDLTRRVRAQVGADTTTTFQFPASVGESGTHPVNVTLRYTDDGDRRRVSRTFRATFDEPDNPGAIRLTGTEAVARGGSLEVSATASNVGSGAVKGVVVSVADAPNVGSATYFVGSVDASDFSSFTLTTSLTGNVSSVPVEVRYIVDGVERTFTAKVPVERRTVRRPDADGGGLPVIPVAGLLVVLVAVGLGYRRWG